MYNAAQPIHDPICIIMLYNNMVSHIPELPNGFTLNTISFIVITVLYHFFLSYGIMRLNYRKLSTFFKSRQTKIVSNTTAKRRRRKRRRRGRHTKTRRPKRQLLLKHYIKMFATTMSLLATAKASARSISFDTDGLPFIIDNSATGAICNERSLFVGSFSQQLVSIETAEGTFTKQRNIGTLRLVLNHDAGSQHSYDVPGLWNSMFEQIICKICWYW